MNSERAPRQPFFIIGNPRSGTTLLRLALTSHPDLVIPPECGFMMWLHPQFGTWSQHDFLDRAKISEFSYSVAATRKFETWGISGEEIETAIALHQPNSYAEACACVYRIFCSSIGKSDAIWGDKNNYYLSHIQALRKLFPESRFIHIVRDGRDVACSYREVMTIKSSSPYRPVLPVAIDKIAYQWRNNIQLIRQSLAALPPSASIALRYEDLTANPKAELTRLCNWMGLDFSTAMMQFYAANSTRHLEPPETIEWKRRTLQPIDTQTVGRYVSILSKHEIDTFVSIAHSELIEYGYLK